MLAYIFGMIAHRLKLSPIIGYLFAGILLGPNVSFVYNADLELANQISEVGVILLMFGVGLHFSVKDLNEVKYIAIPGAIAQVLGTIAVVAIVGHFFGLSWFQAAIFGLCLSVASTVVLLRALNDNNITQTPRGKIAIGWLIVEDLLTVVVLVVLPTMSFMNSGEGFDMGAFGMNLFWTGVKFAAFVFVMFFFGGKIIPAAIYRSAATGSSELFTLATLAISLGIAYIAVEVFNVSYALGAFFAGMILNGSELSHRAADNTLPLRDAFGVLFFVAVGMLFNYSVILTNPLGVVATALVIVVVKSLVAYVLIRAMGKSNRTALTISVSLAQIGEFSFILAGLAVGYGYLDNGQKDLILAGAIISIILNPFLFLAMEKFLKWYDNRVRVGLEAHTSGTPVAQVEATPDITWEAPEKTTEKAKATVHEGEQNLANPDVEIISGASSVIPLSEEEFEKAIEDDHGFTNNQVLMSKHTIVVGYSSIGKAIVDRLNKAAIPVVVITNNLDEFYETNRVGVHAIFGDFKNIAHFEEANIKEARAVIFTCENIFEIGYTVDKIFTSHPELFINANFSVSAIASYDDEVEFLEQHHVTDIINLRDMASLVLYTASVKDHNATFSEKEDEEGYTLTLEVDKEKVQAKLAKREALAAKAQVLVDEKVAKEKAKAEKEAAKEAERLAAQAEKEAEEAAKEAKAKAEDETKAAQAQEQADKAQEAATQAQEAAAQAQEKAQAAGEKAQEKVEQATLVKEQVEQGKQEALEALQESAKENNEDKQK
ncbi:cation:proton antiporter [Psittacicella gerlachiana]|nr:cation:proton antiporter [Psittacicella gerlachiana]